MDMERIPARTLLERCQAASSAARNVGTAYARAGPVQLQENSLEIQRKRSGCPRIRQSERFKKSLGSASDASEASSGSLRPADIAPQAGGDRTQNAVGILRPD